MIFIIAFINATSVPVLNSIYISAILAVGVYLGSATITFAPFFLALITLRANNGCASILLEPIIKITSASSILSYPLVLAPEPKAVASPATVGP